MDINVKVDIPALDRIADLVAAHLAGQPAAAPGKSAAVPTAGTSKTTKASATPASEASPEPKASSPSTQSDPSQAGDAATGDEPAVEYKVVKQLILDLVAKKGREAATTLLGEYGAKGGGDLKDTDYAAFAAKAQALLDA